MKKMNNNKYDGKELEYKNLKNKLKTIFQEDYNCYSPKFNQNKNRKSS